jgi:hypothetical protein
MFVIYHTRAYARKIARELKVTAYFPNQDVLSRRRQRMSAVVNWGCSNLRLPARVVIGEARILNADVRISTSKRATFAALVAAGLPIPCIVTDAHELVDGVPFYMRGKYLGRKDGLTGGAGITIYEKGQLPREGTTHDFFSQVVSKALEVRLHVAGGAIICEQFKTVPQGSHVLIRNFDNGARFSAVPLHTRIESTLADRARAIAISATNACGLDFRRVGYVFNQAWGVEDIRN